MNKMVPIYSKNKVTEQQRQRLASNTVAWLEGERSGDMIEEAYENSNGRAALERFFKKQGTPAHREMDIMPQLADIAIQATPDNAEICLVDIGTGESDKIVQFVQAFNQRAGTSKRITEVIPMDIVREYADGNADKVRPFVAESRGETCDLREASSQIQAKSERILATSFNSFIWNAPRIRGVSAASVYISELSKIRKLIGNGQTALITHYPLERQEQRDAAISHYESDDSREANFSIIDFIEQTLNPNLEPELKGKKLRDLFDFSARISNDDIPTMEMVLTPNTKFKLSLPPYFSWDLSEETALIASRSAKPRLLQARELLEKASLKTSNMPPFETPERDIVAHTMTTQLG